jgi:hypothetical protein
MAVGGVSNQISSHQAGASALWHDADYLPEERLEIPVVQKGLEGAPLPSEEHHSDDISDPFQKQEIAYDAAAAQMERGLRGVEFLHGNKNRLGLEPESANPIAQSHIEENVSHQRVDPNGATQIANMHDVRAMDDQLSKRQQVGQSVPQVSKATSDVASTQQAKKAMDAAAGIGVGLAAATAGQALDPTGATTGLATEAASLVKAVSTAKLTVGMAQDVQDANEADQARARRMAEAKTRLMPLGDEDDGPGSV